MSGLSEGVIPFFVNGEPSGGGGTNDYNQLINKPNNHYCSFTTNSSFSPVQVFNKVAFPIVSDPSLFSDNEYLVTESGLYLTGIKVRLQDDAPKTSFGIGAHTATQDGGHFSWDETGVGKRQTINYFQMVNAAAGQTIKFFTYGSPILTIQNVSGFIFKI